MNIERGGFQPEPSAEKKIDHTLYHVAGFEPDPNDEIIELKPGTQNATGKGVYFTEGFSQLKFAGGEKNNNQWDKPYFNIFKVELDHDLSKNWFRAKNKPNRPRFWHSKDKILTFDNNYEEQEIDGHLCHIYSELIEEDTEE